MKSTPKHEPAKAPPRDSEAYESARRLALKEYCILDSPPERQFDDIARLAGLACRAPIALITFLDGEREWCKAAIGIERVSWPREISFGVHTVAGSDLLRAGNATNDPRFAAFPLVTGGPGVRFYAGIPLISPSGVAVGALCVMDTKPRRLSADQEDALRALARQTVAALESRREPNGENLGKFFEFALDMFCIAGFDGYFKRLNHAWERTLGYSIRQLMERPYLEFVHPDDRESTLAVAAGVASGDELISFENRYRCKDGSYKWLRWTSRPVMDEQIIYAVARDITERKNAQEALRDSQAKIEAIIDNTPAVVYVKDLEGRYMLINRTYEMLFGVERRAVKGKTDFDIFDRDAAGAFRANDQRVIEARAPIQFEETAPHPDGPHTYVSVKFPLNDAVGNLYAICGISTDITGRKRAEERLAQYARELEDAKKAQEESAAELAKLVRELEAARDCAEAATAAKSEFLAKMSHEIRTPLNGVIGMTQLALDTKLTLQQREYLGLAKDSADHLLHVINEILDFSKAEAGKLELEGVAFNLQSAIEGGVEVLALAAFKKGIELTCEVRQGVPEVVIGDAKRLRQIVVNLVGNAVKFTDQGEVAVRVESGVREGDEVEIFVEVRDTGVGIPADRMRAIFGAFEQADSSTTRRFGGTGLGLSISTRLVELMGGKIWAESQPGKGSVFHFTARFPLPEERAKRSFSDRWQRLSGVPVLIVDDNETNRRILEQTFLNWGMQPSLAEDGPAALAAMRRAHEEGRRFELAVVDFQMPGMDGFTLCDLIRQDPQLNGTVLIMLTSVARPGDDERGRAAGVQVRLTKPVRQSELFDAVNTVLVEPRASALSTGAADSAPSHPGGLRVLVVEDNHVNQKLATSLLRNHGHTAVVAANGQQALDTLERQQDQPFDVILMDVEMPVMGGFEATARIREREQRLGGHIPIVVMTAHALPGDRERCLAAGMDAYVSKPIDAENLLGVIAGLVLAPPRSASRARKAVGPAPEFDGRALLARVSNDRALLNELVDLFLQECPQRIAEIQKAVDRGDFESLRLTAHALKGSIGNFDPKGPAYRTALALEKSALQGGAEGLSDLAAALRSEVQRLGRALHAYAIGSSARRHATSKTGSKTSFPENACE